MTITDPELVRQMQAAFEARDRGSDGRFVVAVHTTGIYCRPSCPARRPRPENISFFEDNPSAESAGFRPCMRCKPDEAARDEVALRAALVFIERAETPPTLDELAQVTGYSPAHIQRLFKRATGLSPAAYARALREERAREVLSGGSKVTHAIYDAGFESASRFYDTMEGKLGMKPSAWARGGQGVTIHWAIARTSYGPMLVAATEKGVCRLSFNETAEDLAERFPNAELVEGGQGFAELFEQVIAAVEAPERPHAIPLDVQGTAFQQRIWEELRKVPAGETRSYAEIAAAAGKPKAVRAAGSANGANHVAVLIPCHRVVRSDGSAGGYAYGTEIKEQLLERERQTKL